MRKMVFLAFLIVFISYNIKIFTQTITTGVTGIPLLLYTCEQASRPYSNQSEITGIKALNPDMVIFANINDTYYNTLTGSPYNLKLIPNQFNTSSPSYKITEYCDAYYGVWEAEGNTNFKAKLSAEAAGKDFNITENNINYKGIQNKDPQPGLLLKGPGYYQDKTYNRVLAGDLITYYLNAYIKIKKTGNIELNDPTIQNNLVCNLRVVYKGVIDGEVQNNSGLIKSIPIYVSDFSSYSYDWATISMDYTLDPVPLPSIVELKRGIANPKQIGVGYIDFEIEWAGSSYFDLYVDKLIVYDQRGLDIMTNTTIQNEVKNAATYQNNTANIPAWTTIDEPKSIDNYACLKKVSELISSTSPNRKLYFCFDPAPWYHGKYGKGPDGTFALNQTEEFWGHVDPAKAGINISFAIDPYFYNSPNINNNKTAYRENISNLISNIFAPLLGRNFTYVVQGHSALVYLLPPPREHMLYSTNLGLLYGAKEIAIYNYYTVNGGLDIGLLDENMNQTYRYNCVRDEIYPLLKGNLGQTIKNLDTIISTEPARKRFQSVSSTTSISSPSVSKVIPPSNTDNDIDIGFFKDRVNNDYKYFYIINGWYSEATAFTYQFQNLTGYTNWKLSEYQNAAIADYNVSTSVSYTDNLAQGQGKLFRLAPVVKYGGKIVSNETITSETLTSPLTIGAGNSLTINGNYTANNQLINIEVNTSGASDIWGNLVFGTSGVIINSNIETALIASKDNDHPKLVWGVPNPATAGTYQIYRKKETSDFVLGVRQQNYFQFCSYHQAARFSQKSPH